MNSPHEIDFISTWRAYLLHRDPSRLDAAIDRAFWVENAPLYDAGTAADGSYGQTLNALLQLVCPGDSVLDVGAGTGRFALPLAQVARRVTALDHAPAMLEILRYKVDALSLRNVNVIEAAWEEAAIEPHDLVLAAWSLYRQLDLAQTLQKLIDAARRTLVIVAADDFDPPHRRLVQDLWGCDGEPDVPASLYLLGALWQLGTRAELHVLYETRKYCAATPRGIAAQLAPKDAKAKDLERLANELASSFERGPKGWQYEFRFPVSLIVWQRSN